VRQSRERDNDLGCLRAIVPCWGVFSAFGTSITFIACIAIAATMIPGLGLMAAFHPSIITLSVLMAHHSKKLREFVAAYGSLGIRPPRDHEMVVAARYDDTEVIPAVAVAVSPESSSVTNTTRVPIATTSAEVLEGRSGGGGGGSGSLESKLAQLNDAHTRGIITDEELAAGRDEALRVHCAA
jgi:hypothetical protein